MPARGIYAHADGLPESSKAFDVFMNLCAQMAVIDNAAIAYQRLKRKAQRLKRKEAKRGRAKSLVRPF